MVRRIVLLMFLLLMSPLVRTQTGTSLINFSHLVSLTERIMFENDSVDIVHIYSNYPNYDWVAAAESGEEGIACVDDAARAALLYLRNFELTRDTVNLTRARYLVKFVQHMETDDGMFYNFIRPDHSINTKGRTSFSSFGWWAARGLWCLAAGYRAFRTIDPAFAESLKGGVERTFPHIDSLLQHYNSFKTVKGLRVPRWLLYESGSDVTSVLVLGLSEYLAVSHNPKVKMYIRKFADGLIAMQNGNLKKFPYGAHRSWETMWHMWGNDQSYALAVAGTLLHNKEMIASAEREARGFFTRLLIEGFKKEMDVASDSSVQVYDQIAYGVRPMVAGLLHLYRATRKPDYLTMAGLAASWLFGNNVAHQVMYDSSTGICYDGIRDSVTVNKNSGAESTIEALWTLVELAAYPRAVRCCQALKVAQTKDGNLESALFQTPGGEKISVALDLRKGRMKVNQVRGGGKSSAGKRSE